MNDCLFMYMGCCPIAQNSEVGCGADCKQYISVNSDEGFEISEQYAQDVEDSLAPLRRIYWRMHNKIMVLSESEGYI